MKKFYLLLLLIGFFACQEQPVEIPDLGIFESDRVILIEELTGVDCANCPRGTAAAEAIQFIYPANIVVVGVHGNLLSYPIDGSDCDFRFEEAADLEEYLKFWYGKPAAAINRTQVMDQVEFSVSDEELWLSFVEQEFQKPHVLDLTAQVDYDENTKDFSVDVEATVLENLDGDYNVTVMLTQSHIIDSQNDDGTVVFDYEHNHVLRMFATPFDGASLGSNLIKDAVITKSFNGTLAEDADCPLIAEDMDVVVFVHRIDSSLKTVLQAYHAHLTE